VVLIDSVLTMPVSFAEKNGVIELEYNAILADAGVTEIRQKTNATKVAAIPSPQGFKGRAAYRGDSEQL
jgi:hypothetical protein